MRLIYSILLSLGIALFFGLAAQAGDLIGSQAELLKSSRLSADSLEKYNHLCDDLGYLTIPNKANCEKTLKSVAVSQFNFEYCLDKSTDGRVSAVITCLQQVNGYDHPLDYLKACERTAEKRFGGVETSSPRMCLNYLATTKSSFDSEAFDLCMKVTERNFKYAKSCLNSVRDRQVDVQKLKRECLENGKAHDETLSCIDKLADAAPMISSCANKAPSSSSKAAGAR